MEDAKGNGQLGVGEIGIEGGKLIGSAEGFVGHRPERERSDIRGPAGTLCPPACTVSAGLCFVERRAERLEQDELLDQRHARSGLLAERAGHHGDLAPPSQTNPLRGAGRLDLVAGGVVAQEDHPQPAPGRRNERPRNRQQDSGPVSRPPVGRHGAAMTKPREPLQDAVEDRARGLPRCIGEKADAAGVAFATQGVERRMHGCVPFV